MSEVLFWFLIHCILTFQYFIILHKIIMTRIKLCFCSVEAESIFFSIHLHLPLGRPKCFAFMVVGCVSTTKALTLYLQDSAPVYLHLLGFTFKFVNRPSQYLPLYNRMILWLLLFWGVSGSVSIGYKVQGLRPGWSSSKNPPIWQHIGFSSHPSGSQ